MAVKPKPTTARRAASRRATTAPSDRLASIPPQEFFDSYIGRDVAPGVSDFATFEFAAQEKMNVLIEGPTGPGKTSAVMAYAAKEQKAFYAIPSNIGIEPSQLFGKFIPDATSGGFKWVDGPVTDIVRHGGVLLLNEVNFIPERVATVLFGLLDKRRQITLLDHEAETIDAHDDLLIVADMNPDYEGTRPLNKAFRNRFAVQVWWDYDSKVEAQLVKCSALRDMANQFRKEQKAGTYETPCSTNMLMEFERIFPKLGFEFSKSNFINHFASDERQAAGVVVEAHKANIINGLSPQKKRSAKQQASPGAVDPKVQELEAIIDETRKADGHQSIIQNDEGEYILMDNEWGVYGVDWEFDDDEAPGDTESPF